MKRYALTAFALYAAWIIVPNFFSGPDVTRACTAEKVELGMAGIPGASTSRVWLNCSGTAIPDYKLPIEKRQLAALFGAGGEYRVVTNEGSWLYARTIVSAAETKTPPSKVIALSAHPKLDAFEISEPRFTITYPCASFERAGLPFPAGTEARYPAGCNVFAELDADKREARRIAQAETAQAGWSDVKIVTTEQKPIKAATARVHKPAAKKPEVLPWLVAVKADAYQPPVRVHKPKTMWDTFFNPS
ncbi:MAG: hypothetical protein EBQ96_08705 [Proteobacteria bacterium]|nr:hypothetical protein [Pseudomonadota bacterium]